MCAPDDCEASTNVDGCDGGSDGASGGCSCGYNDEDDDNENWALWEENNHYFYMMPLCASYGYKPARNGQMPVSTHEYFLPFSATFFLKKQLLKLTNIKAKKKTVQYGAAMCVTSSVFSPRVP
jgi:hypothetical protein